MIVRELLIKLGVQRDRGSFERANRGIDQLKTAANAAVVAFGAIAGARGLGAIINAASEAEERVNKFNAVFLEAAPATAAAVQDIANRTKQSSDEIEGFAANIGALIKPALGSADAAGKMGARVAELALDIASFNDLEPQVALEKLRSGLIGSVEPLQSVGVDVRVNSKHLQDYARSLGKSFDKLTEGQKVTARFLSIQKQLGSQGALGDAAKTADGYANASRALVANLKQLGATIGKFLLGRAAKSAVFYRDTVKQVRDWIEANRELIQSRVDRVLNFITDTGRALGSILKTIVEGWRLIGEVLGPVGSKLLIVAGVMGLLTAILGLPVALMLALGAAALLVLEDWQKFQDGGQSVIGTLIAEFDKLVATFGGVDAALGELAERFITFFLEDILGVSEDTARGIGFAFGAVFRSLARLFENFGTAVGAVLAGPVTALSELAQGNFAAAARAIDQAKGDLGGALADSINVLMGGVFSDLSGPDANAIRRAHQQRAEAAQLGSTQLFGGIQRAVGAVGAGGAGNAARASIQAQMSVQVNPSPGQSDREIGIGIGEGAAREQNRQLRAANSAVPGGAR